MAAISNRYGLCKQGSSKDTQHVVLDLRGSGYKYEVGDCIGVFPIHDAELVQRTLNTMKASGTETVLDKHSGEHWQLKHFLTRKANITEISRKLLGEIAKRQTNPEKKAFLDDFQNEHRKDALKDYLENHELWDILLENEEVAFEIQELCNMLMPLLPRLYSIASSMKFVGDEVHLTIALVHYDTNGHKRRGVCTHYLCELAPVNQPLVPIYIQPHHGFTLPQNPNVPIIMIGPGTGVAPFRAFMQERIATGSQGKNWLFFGERNRIFDFLYEDYWEQLVREEKLILHTAFSRDQNNKVYVQHRMLEHGAELFSWLKEGAYLYVCGDAKCMAKDVEAALHQIVQTHGGLDEQATKQYIKQLRSEKRYLRDVY